MNVLKYSQILFSLFMAGCMMAGAPSAVSRQINVFGIELYSGTDYREIDKISATEEPCLRGYERTFDALDLTIGYGFNRKIRKITTRNPETSVFGIKPGMSAEEGRRQALQSGLSEDSSVRFTDGHLSLLLLIDSKGNVFGVTVESLEQ